MKPGGLLPPVTLAPPEGALFTIRNTTRLAAGVPAASTMEAPALTQRAAPSPKGAGAVMWLASAVLP